MNQAITVGMMMWALVAILGVVGVIGACLWVLSLFADAFKH